jgi:hypothetical protein
MLPKWLSPATSETFLWNLLVLRTMRRWSERELVLFKELFLKVGTQKDPNFWTMNRRVRWSIVTILSKSRGEDPPVWLQNQIELQKRNGYNLPQSLHRIHGWLGSKEWNRLVVWRKTTRYQTPKPPRRIGVGYRDQGTYRNKAKDGSPSWQEVASFGVPDSGKPILTPPLECLHSPWGPHETRDWRGRFDR